MGTGTFYRPYWKAIKKMVLKMNEEELNEAEEMMELLQKRIDERKNALGLSSLKEEGSS